MKQTPKVIALYGPKRSGKDTIADMMAQALGPDLTERVAFATAVRDTVASAFGVPRAWFHRVSTDGATKEEPMVELRGRSPRDLLVETGCMYRDHVDPLHWCRTLSERYRNFLGDTLIVTDCRFRNEAQYLQEHMGAVVVGVFRPEAWSPFADNDRAAKAVYDGFDRAVDTVIVNNGDLDALRTTVERTVNALDPFAAGTLVRMRHNPDTIARLEYGPDQEGNFLCYVRSDVGVKRHLTVHRSELIQRTRFHVADPGNPMFLEGPYAAQSFRDVLDKD